MAQTIPFGPNTFPANLAAVESSCTYQLTASSAQQTISTYFNAQYARRIVSLGNGTIALSRRDDGGNFYTQPVSSGTVINGIFAAIGATGSGTTIGLVFNIEV